MGVAGIAAGLLLEYHPERLAPGMPPSVPRCCWSGRRDAPHLQCPRMTRALAPDTLAPVLNMGTVLRDPEVRAAHSNIRTLPFIPLLPCLAGAHFGHTPPCALLAERDPWVAGQAG